MIPASRSSDREKAVGPASRRLRTARMVSLLLGERPAPRSVAEVVRWFGALQGQDFASVQWSLGIRTGLNRPAVMRAFESGEILRTWPMRGTLHVVPGEDARWMLTHLGARALRGAAARRRQLGLSESDGDRAAEVLAERLSGGRAMTRSECVAALEGAGIAGDGQRAYHLLWYVSQQGVTCVGPQRGSQQTFVLIDEFAPRAKHLDRHAALVEIAGRFVRSHGPVAAHDLARWADLTITDARAGLAAVDGLVSRSYDGRDLFGTEAQHETGTPVLPARALPGFDELVLGYRDRTAQIDAEAERRVVPGGNGVFAPTLVLDGRVVGSWKRRERAGGVEILATPFVRISAPDRRRLEVALQEFAGFVGKSGSLGWSDRPTAA